MQNPTANDCLVAIYTDFDDAPSPGDLPDLDRGVVPPSWDMAIGQLSGYFNLARVYAQPDRDEVNLHLAQSEEGASHHYISVATCASGGIEGTISLSARFCDDSPHLQGTAPINDQSVVIEQIW